MNRIALSAGTLHYRDSGSGEPIVFVHGVAVNGALWRKVVPELEGEFRCIAPDWPLGAHSEPMKADADLSPGGIARLVAEFLEALDLRGATLVGNDTGGAVCQLVAARRPERVGRLVLTPCDAFDNFPPPMFRYLTIAPRIPGLPFVLAQSMRLPFVRRLPFVYGRLSKRPVEAAVLESYVRPFIENAGVRRDGGKAMATLSPRYTREVLPALAGFDRPVLLAWATEDPFFPYAHAEKLQKIFPRAALEPIEDSFTFVSEDRPERLAAAIRGFCAANPGSGSVSIR